MLKYDLTTPNGLSGFIKNLKRKFIERDADLRQSKDSKVLHAAAEAMDMNDWKQLSQEMQTRPLAGTRVLSQAKTAKAESTMTDLLALNRAIEQGDYSEDLEDSIFGTAARSIELAFVLGSDRTIYFTVELDKGEYDRISAARIEVLGFDEIGIRIPTTDELGMLTDLFESKIIDALGIFLSQ